MLAHLRELGFGKVHQSIDFLRRALEVLNGERVHGHGMNTQAKADLKDLYQGRLSENQSRGYLWIAYTLESYEAFGMTLLHLEMATPSIASVPIHHKCNMTGHRPCSKDLKYRILDLGADSVAQPARAAGEEGERHAITCDPVPLALPSTCSTSSEDARNVLGVREPPSFALMRVTMRRKRMCRPAGCRRLRRRLCLTHYLHNPADCTLGQSLSEIFHPSRYACRVD